MATAQAILDSASCGQPGCPCAISARRGKGKTHCPAHADDQPSLEVSEQSDGAVLVHCFAGCSQAAVISALQERGLWDARRERRRNGYEQWQLRDPLDGRLIAIHFRKPDGNGGKTMHWERDGNRGLMGIRTADLPLYGAHKLGELATGATLVVTEGEKSCDALVARGITAVATVCGARVIPCDATLRVLSPFTVLLWPDNDEPGVAHMRGIAARLHALNIPCRIVHWKDAPAKGDAADFQGDADALAALIAAATVYESEPVPDGADLLDDIVNIITSYVVLSREQADAVALYIALTYIVEIPECVPYVHVTSPEKRSGKSRLLEVLELLVARPWLTGRVSAAVLIRRLERDNPTLLLDEADGVFRVESEYSEALRTILNAGHRRGVPACLCVKRGADFELAEFAVFGPKVIAGIGALPDTIADRSIRIELRRRAPNEPIQRFRRREADAMTAPIRQRLEQWANAHLEALREARPSIPPSLDDRAADGWEPILAIADAAGGDWPRRAREAALVLSSGDMRNDESIRIRLLTDIRAIFEERRTDRLASADLVAALNADEEAPWGDLEGRALDARRLARLLRPLKIKPGSIRLADGQTPKGYHADAFSDAWSRYVPILGEPPQAPQAQQAPDSDSRAVAAVAAVAANSGIRKHKSPLVQAALSYEGVRLIEPDDDLPAEVIAALDDPATRLEVRCHVCGGVEFWMRPDGTGPVCSRCHPNPALAVEAWQRERERGRQ